MIRIGAVNIDTSHPLGFGEVMEKSNRARYVGVYNDSFRSDSEVASFEALLESVKVMLAAAASREQGGAPVSSEEHCLFGCDCKDACPYDAEKIYIFNDKSGIRSGNDEWPCSVLVNQPTEEKLYAALRTGPYGRCVYRCDNDVVDHQVVSMRFAGGATATFTMSAFTAKCYRSVKVMGTMGEIEGDMDANVLYVRKFGQPEYVLDLGGIPDRFAGHGGGDTLMMDYVCELIAAGGAEGLTSVDASVESHVMALAAEYSRTHGGNAVELASFAKA